MAVLKSTPALANYLARVTGEPKAPLVNVARRLREAGELSQAGHGPGAARATPRDAATLLLVSMASRKAVHAPIVAEALQALKRVGGTGAPGDIAGLRLTSFKERDPISVVEKLIKAEMKGDSPFEGIDLIRVVTTGRPVVLIFWGDDSRYWSFEPPEGSRAFRRYRKIKAATQAETPYVSNVDVHGSIVQSLAIWLEDE